MINSKRKGKSGELEVAKLLQGCGYNTRRGQQFSGTNGDADVEGLPGIHIEVKRREKTEISNWMQQSANDSYAHSLREGREMLPVVIHRQNTNAKKPYNGVWKVTMMLKDFMKLYEAAGWGHGEANDER